MSGNNGTPPRSARAKHGHSRTATQPPQNNSAKQPQRRQKGNRNNQINHHNAQQRPSSSQQPDSETAIFSSEDGSIPTGPRSSKKQHTQSQPSGTRVGPPYHASSLTDSETSHSHRIAATPAKPTAYAGPTFHASPAPSTLPMPKFFSKSVPASIDQPEVSSPPHDASGSSASPSPAPSPSRVPTSVPPRNEESPLDILFKLDRQEKAKKQDVGVNGTGRPNSATFFADGGRPNPPPAYRGHSKQDSHGSPRGVFPIELDAQSPASQAPRPAQIPANHRSVTAPSAIPTAEASTAPEHDAKAMKELLLSLSQKRPESFTPPKTADRVPSAPSSRYQTPSPFTDARTGNRSASGPTTPAPSAHESSESAFFYGNRNLSPLFKAAKQDSPKRNSGLRTELSADSPTLPQGGFPPVPGPNNNMDPNTVSRNYLDNVINPDNRRRSSVPHNPPIRQTPNNRRPRTPAQHRQSRPDSYPYSNKTPANSKPKTALSFMPSSVQANFQQPKPAEAASLEQDLKRMLNLNSVPGSISGVR